MARVIKLMNELEVIAMNSTQSRAARRALDRRLSQLPPAATFTPPARGWIRALRNALGMSAMGCELVYALIPRGSLTEIVQHQAQAKVGRQVHAVSRAMDLEAQSTQFDDEVVREEMQRLIDSGRLWK
jgi:hypothetical protein